MIECDAPHDLISDIVFYVAIEVEVIPVVHNISYFRIQYSRASPIYYSLIL